MSENELLELLEFARINNKANDVTGVLLYSEGTFMQVLEGEKENIEKLFKIIELDSRHKNIIKLVNGTSQKRNFPDWPMGFASVKAEVFQDIDGFFDPGHKNFLWNEKLVNNNMLSTFATSNNLNISY